MKGSWWLDFHRKKKHIINRSQNRTISIPSFPEFTSVKLQILLGNQATPLPPNCPPLILHLANGKIQTSHAKMVTCKVHFQRIKINPQKQAAKKKKLKIERIVYSTKTDVSPAHKYIPPKNNAAWIVKKMSLAKKGWSHLQKCVIPISLTNHPSSSDAPPPGLAFFSYGHLLIIFQMKPVITIGWGSTLNAKEKNCFGELCTPPKI